MATRNGTSNNDTIVGTEDDDTLRGYNGQDKLYGKGGNDTIEGGDGDDYIDGGSGHDSLSGGSGQDYIKGGSGNDYIDGGDGVDTLLGGCGDDTILGGQGTDFIDGGSGNDLLAGGADPDIVHGGSGNDTIYGATDGDHLYGDDDRDTFVIQKGAGNAYIWGGEGGDDFDTLDLSNMSPDDYILHYDPHCESGWLRVRDDWGNFSRTVQFREIEKVVICFTPGTSIATPQGERLVEDLREGDRVFTRDNGVQRIRWAGKKNLAAADLEADARLNPVLIRAGALGNGLPERDMMVSPCHRMLINSDRAAMYFDEREVLAAAKHLTEMQGVDQVRTGSVTYHHILFDRHEIILGNGAWTESFQPGDYSLRGIGSEQRQEILMLFPELADQEGAQGFAAARQTLKRHEARLLV
ncbi:type I secretion protein [Mesobaculum littorinae]|uniref:Type I secretion protein n=1 Tax=Mesobaculum littorinae TaxID=2486419 RepID=A0A438ALY7_9RHOB|nr:Hint domain-containing protein [Mesobaculum littorinae]RVV99660.1 type I secretion protein [Mesobaculum littorinae]